MINHNAWGAELSTDPVERTRITAMREGLALVGVVVASVAPALLGGAAGPRRRPRARSRSRSRSFTLACAAVTLRAPTAPRRAAASVEPLATARRGAARRPAVPPPAGWCSSPTASRRPSPRRWCCSSSPTCCRRKARQGLFLALYFVAGGVGMPLWVRLSARLRQGARVDGRHGRGHRRLRLGVRARARATPARSRRSACCRGWRWAPTSRCRRRCWPTSSTATARARPTGAYFGLWTLATKLNLALAAGIALPLLGAAGLRARRARPAAAAGVRSPSSTRSFPACSSSARSSRSTVSETAAAQAPAMILKTTFAVARHRRPRRLRRHRRRAVPGREARARPRALLQRHRRRLGHVPGPLRQGRQALHRAHRRALGRRHRDARRALRVRRRREAEPRLEARQERRPLRRHRRRRRRHGHGRGRRQCVQPRATCWRCRSTAGSGTSTWTTGCS